MDFNDINNIAQMFLLARTTESFGHFGTNLKK